MASNTLNKVFIIGFLAVDPELKQTQNGSSICRLSVATNQEWKTESGEKRESVEYHRVVVFGVFAETCDRYLRKGDKVFVEGVLQTSSWEGNDGTLKQKTEVISKNMLFLNNKRAENPSEISESGESREKEKIDIDTDLNF